MNLPPLPEPDALVEECEAFEDTPSRKYASFTEKQMRAYAEAAALAMQDRIAAWLDEQHQKRKHLDNHAAFYAAAIRALE